MGEHNRQNRIGEHKQGEIRVMRKNNKNSRGREMEGQSKWERERKEIHQTKEQRRVRNKNWKKRDRKRE